jgi:hypothetical protein
MVRLILSSLILLSLLVSTTAFTSQTHPRTIRRNAFRLQIETRFSIEQICKYCHIQYSICLLLGDAVCVSLAHLDAHAHLCSLDREPEAVPVPAVAYTKEDSRHAAAYSGSYNGLTRPTQAMAWLGVAIAGGLAVYSPEFSALKLASGSVDFWSVGVLGDVRGMVPLSVLSAASSSVDLWTKINLPDLATVDVDWSMLGVSDVAQEYHLQNLASLPSVDAKSMMESWVLQPKQAMLSHLDATLQASPTVHDFQEALALDTTEWVQTAQSKVIAFHTAFSSRVQAMDMDLDSRASVVEAAYKSQVAQLETYKESVLQQEKVWTEQLVQQAPIKVEQWMATIKSQVQTLLTEAMPQYGREIAGQFQAVLPKEMPDIQMPLMDEIQFPKLPEMKVNMPSMEEFEFSMPEFSLPHQVQVQAVRMPEISVPHQVQEFKMAEIPVPQVKEIVAAPIQVVTPPAPIIETLSKPTFLVQTEVPLAKPAFLTPPAVVQSYQPQWDRMTESLLLSK